MTTAYINPEMIIWARKRSGIAVEDLEQRFSSKYFNWEEGQFKPIFKQAYTKLRSNI